MTNFSNIKPDNVETKSKLFGLFCMPKRYIITILCMLFNALSYTMRTNINLTIVAMVQVDESSNANGTSSDTCPDNQYFSSYQPTVMNSVETFQDLEKFDWSDSLQGTILGAFYYGYIITNFNGGQLATFVGTKRLLFLSMLFSGGLTLLVPVSATLHPYSLVVIRIITGLAQGVVTPSIYTLLAIWTPREELGVAIGLIQASGNIGAMVTMPICAYLSEYGFAGGWPSVFYVLGAFGMLALIPWLYFVYDSPDKHPTITDVEYRHILANSSASKNASKMKAWVPWRSIFTSRKVWAISITKFCFAWGNLFLMTKLPAYLESVLNMPITYNGYVNASIYITFGSSLLIWGFVSDYVEQRHCINRTMSRKLFESLALLGSAFFLAVVPLMDCNIILVIVMLNLAMLTMGLVSGGDSIIVVDIAPDYSGSVYGVSNAIASLPGFMAPLFVGIMLDQEGINLKHQWSILFWIGSSFYVLGAFVFLLFIDSKPEKWGHAPKSANSSVSENTTTAMNAPLEINIIDTECKDTKIEP